MGRADDLAARYAAASPEERQRLNKEMLGASRGSGRRSKRRDPEATQQRAYLAQLAIKLPIVREFTFSVPNERMSKGETGRMLALGMSPGVCDLLCPLPTRTGHGGFAIEFKAPERAREDNPLAGCTDSQIAWLERFKCCGWFACVRYTAESALQTALEHYGE